MKQIFPMFFLCMLSGISAATFEIEDPSQIIGKDEARLESKASRAEEEKDTLILDAEVETSILDEEIETAMQQNEIAGKVIIPAGINYYVPVINGGECNGWRVDQSEARRNANDQTVYTSKTTFTGDSIKTIRCINGTEGRVLWLSLVQINQDRLVWVASDQALSAD